MPKDLVTEPRNLLRTLLTVAPVIGLSSEEAMSGQDRDERMEGKGGAQEGWWGDTIWVELKEITESPPNMVLTSVSGDVTLLLPENISAEIDARTTSGRISLEFKILVEDEIRKRRLRGTIGGGDIPITLKTTSGDISVEKA